jgi:hypothetical protein
MPASVLPRRRRARRPQLRERTPLVPVAAAREIVDEASRALGVLLPARYATGLAHRAARTFAHSASFRRELLRPGDAGRDALWMFLRHWLADRLHSERPNLYRLLPRDYAAGAEPPAITTHGAHLLSVT